MKPKQSEMELSACDLPGAGEQQSQRARVCDGPCFISSEVASEKDHRKPQLVRASNALETPLSIAQKVSLTTATSSSVVSFVAAVSAGTNLADQGQTTAQEEKPHHEKINQTHSHYVDFLGSSGCGRDDTKTSVGMSNSEHLDIRAMKKKSFRKVEPPEERCNITLWVLIALNLFLVVLVTSTVCIVPLISVGWIAMKNGFHSLTGFSSESVGRSVGTIFLTVQGVIDSVFTSLQFDQTTQLYEWTDEDMPTVMQQLCGVMNSSLFASNLLYLGLSSPKTGFGAYCSNQYDSTGLVGKHTRGNIPDYFYEVDPLTLVYAQPMVPIVEMCNLTEEQYTINLASSENPYNNIAVPWKAKEATQRWLPYKRFGELLMTYTYPFLDYKGNLAIITGAFRLTRLLNFYSGRRSMDGMVSSVIMELLSGVVINVFPQEGIKNGRWNCTGGTVNVSVEDNMGTYDTTKHPIMLVALEKLGGKEGIMMLLRQEPHASVAFDHKGSTFVVTVDHIEEVSDLTLASIMVIDRGFMVGPLTQAYKKVLIMVGIFLGFLLLIELLLFYFFLRPLRKTLHGLHLLSELRDASETLKGTSIITEILLMRCRLFSLNHKLGQLKTLTSPEVLKKFNSDSSVTELEQLIEGEARDGNGWSLDTAEENGASSAAAISTGSPGVILGSANNSILNCKVNDFRFHLNESSGNFEVSKLRRRYCTVVCARTGIYDCECHNDAMIQEFLKTSVQLAIRFGGVVEILRPDFVMITFGAHSNMPRNQSQGVCFSLELMKLFKSEIMGRFTLVVDSAEYLIGSCKVEGRNTCFTFGYRIPMQVDMLKNMQHLKCHLLVTQSVSNSLDGQFLTIPVDAVFCSLEKKPIIMYELRGRTEALEPESLTEVQNTVRVIRHAFANMLGGRYEDAFHLLNKVNGKDFQGDRLLRVCRRFIRKGMRKPYHCIASRLRVAELFKTNGNVNLAGVSSNIFMLPILQGERSLLGPAELENTLLCGVSACAASMMKHVTMADSNTYTMADDEYDQGLFEVFLDSPESDDDDGEVVDVSPMVSSQASGSMAPAVRGNIKGEIPFIFKDYQGNIWTRSVDRLGIGAFSVVYRGMSSSGDLVALKCFALRARNIELDNIVEELKLFSQLQHENIVRYISCYFSCDYLIEVMELVPGGSLDSIISSFGCLPTMAVRRFLRDVLNGLMYLHSKSVVHCDVKPHNVLVAMDGVCKLSDFGSSLLRLTNSMRNISDVLKMRGTPGYMAPEVARGEVPTTKSDIFSLGITVLELLTGRLPWSYVGAKKSDDTKSGSQGQWEHVEEEEEEEREKKKAGSNDGNEAEVGFIAANTSKNAVTVVEEERVEKGENQKQSLESWEARHEASPVIPPLRMSLEDSSFVPNADKNIETLLRNPVQLVISVGKGEVKPVVPMWLGDEVLDFLKSCLAFDPEKRPTVSQLLQHPWML